MSYTKQNIQAALLRTKMMHQFDAMHFVHAIKPPRI